MLPRSNVIKYKLEKGAWVCLGSSGTEPKVKFYFGVREVDCCDRAGWVNYSTILLINGVKLSCSIDLVVIYNRLAKRY